jgi:dTDP-4-dehydrorhamnose reductase
MIVRQKILVTGANGQLGKSFRDIEPNFPQYEFIFASKEDMPIHHFDMVRHYFRIYNPQWLVNCAAYTAVDRAESEKDMAMQVNGEAVGVLAAITKENNCGFIHISTDYVFDGNATQPYKEDHPVAPQNIYGQSKLEGEKQALQFNPNSIIIRCSWIYSEHGKNFVRTMMKLMSEKKEINVVNDQLGSPTYARDLAEVIMQIIIYGSAPSSPSIYHYCNNGVISWYDFALVIKELTRSECIVHPILTSQYPTSAKRPHYSAMDTSKIHEDFGIQIIDWHQSLINCLHNIIKAE